MKEEVDMAKKDPSIGRRETVVQRSDRGAARLRKIRDEQAARRRAAARRKRSGR